MTVTSDTPSLTGASKSSDSSVETRCIMNMYAHDENDLAEELSEELKNPSGNDIKEFLKDTLHQAHYIQKNAFHYAIPLAQLVLFGLGGGMLLTASTSIALNRSSYRSILIVAFLFLIFAMGTMFATAFGSIQALHKLFNGEDSKMPSWTFNNNQDSIHFAQQLYYFQLAQASAATAFSVSAGVMFAKGIKPNRKGAV